MAKFEIAIKEIYKQEGVALTNHPKDKGKETFIGISRRHWPKWEGWDIIDNYRYHSFFPNILYSNKELKLLVETFYKENFWRPIFGDMILNQDVANFLVKTAVNIGVTKTVYWIQIAVNACNRNQRDWPDIIVDGDFGAKTLDALNIAITHRLEMVMTLILTQKNDYYLTKFLADTTQEIFVGWIKKDWR